VAEEANSMTRPEIPDKLFFKIGEVAQLTGTKPHVLRYWESEFKMLRPAKGESGQRIYRRKDVELIFSIKQLLYEENFTIAGAKKQLQKKRSLRAETARTAAPPRPPEEETPQPGLFGNQSNSDIEQVRKELTELLDFLK
jgi:DNA-binding transcriptional MerR regulator